MGMLIRDILEESAKKFADIKAVKWLQKRKSLREAIVNLWKML